MVESLLVERVEPLSVVVSSAVSFRRCPPPTSRLPASRRRAPAFFCWRRQCRSLPSSVGWLLAGATLGSRLTEEKRQHVFSREVIYHFRRQAQAAVLGFLRPALASSKAFATTASNVDPSFSFSCLDTNSAQVLKPSAKRFPA